jgi:hypothetical protein
LPVPLLTARVRIGASVAPLDTLNLEPGADDASVQVHIRPAEPESLALADTQGKSDRPSGTVPLGRGQMQDAARLLTGQRLDLV